MYVMWKNDLRFGDVVEEVIGVMRVVMKGSGFNEV